METAKTATQEVQKPLSNRDRLALKGEWLDELVEGCRTENDLFGEEGIFTRLKGALMQRLLEAEMAEHLGYEKQERRKGTNARNGYTPKTVQTESGPVEVHVPRDRDGTFQPQLVKKHQRRLEGFDEKVIALYARGMTTRDIAQHLRELYGTDVSAELISRATAGVLQEFQEWQSRPLDSVYPIVYLDALFVSVRDSGQVSKRAFYVALGVRTDGTRDVLGLWVAQTEGAKFWLTVLTELKNRGVDDVLFICADGLSGLNKAIEAAFPNAVVQTCVVHLLRSAMRFGRGQIERSSRRRSGRSTRPRARNRPTPSSRPSRKSTATVTPALAGPSATAGRNSCHFFRTPKNFGVCSTRPTPSSRSTRSCARY
jgi:transposase-like protein